jgi:hypothetical protein
MARVSFPQTAAPAFFPAAAVVVADELRLPSKQTLKSFPLRRQMFPAGRAQFISKPTRYVRQIIVDNGGNAGTNTSFVSSTADLIISGRGVAALPWQFLLAQRVDQNQRHARRDHFHQPANAQCFGPPDD